MSDFPYFDQRTITYHPASGGSESVRAVVDWLPGPQAGGRHGMRGARIRVPIADVPVVTVRRDRVQLLDERGVSTLLRIVEVLSSDAEGHHLLGVV